jgi:hypothetical protein
MHQAIAEARQCMIGPLLGMDSQNDLNEGQVSGVHPDVEEAEDAVRPILELLGALDPRRAHLPPTNLFSEPQLLYFLTLSQH